ncbi:hypothetical protein LZ554_002185 [Drepanopeziza brunnea f. sp. 'monogermtubi']|nr:hypothetical protein LZ554_002185 [Drepanopeziza brunnea f. sp. 'monogermtubi']
METVFPHLTSTGPAPSYRQVMDAYRAAYARRVEEGALRPLVFPYHLYGNMALLAYLCIPHTKSPLIYAARWPVLLAIIAFQWKRVNEDSSVMMATGYASGLAGAWGVILSVTWLVWNKPQFDAKRVNRRVRERQANGGPPREEPDGNPSVHKEENGLADLNYRGPQPTGMTNGKSAKGSSDQEMEYYWQSYPDNFTDRFYWVSDLLVNFRLPGWNIAIPPLPALPPFVKNSLGEPVEAKSRSGLSSIGLQRHDTRAQLVRAIMPNFVVGYFVMDVLKVIMMKDPYFIFGPTTYALPWYLQGCSPFTVQMVRQTISSVAIIVTLEMAFLLAPVYVALICGPQVFGLRAEAWYWPSRWGSWSNITNKGLGGFWGGWWHQTFRFVFSAPSNFLIRQGYVNPKSPAAKFLALFFAFGISGFLHFCGSISQFPSTCKWHTPLFFMLQPVGIVLQMVVCAALGPAIRKMPRVVRKLGNFAFVFAWMFCTGWWLTDDFARGGIWLFEPLPISPLRGLGFGVAGDRWWCWEPLGIGWYTGKHWWESGIAL